MRKLALSLGLLLAPAVAGASHIGIFFSQDGTVCDRTLEAGSQLNIYVIANLGGDAASAGITGAEFRLTGIPTDWFINVQANPAANVNLGSITTGCNIAFPSCQTGISVLLYTINAFAVTAGNEIVLRIERHAIPSNPSWPCPLVVLCDQPVFTKLCVSGACALINPIIPRTCCILGVEAQTWSNVKALYVE